MRNEIRQGNYVSITPFEDETDIIQLNEEEIERLYIFGNWDRIKPIPLTEEWLLKFGFDGWDLGKYTLIRTNGNFFITGHKGPIAQNIFFVHQLQNLYFALTNEELTIKL
jgi:hypothetical protein